MAEYHLTSEAIQLGQRAFRWRFVFITATLLVGGVSYSYWVLHAEPLVAASYCLLMSGVLAYSYFRNAKRNNLVLESYRLLLEPDCISRFDSGMPAMQLPAAAITAIAQHAPGALTISTADKYRAIYVPAQVANRTDLLRELERFGPLTVVERKNWTERLLPSVSIGMLGLMGLFYTVSNKVVSTITGVLLVGILSWSCWHLWRNKNLPQQSQRLLWFMPLVLLSIVAGIVARLLQ